MRAARNTPRGSGVKVDAERWLTASSLRWRQEPTSTRSWARSLCRASTVSGPPIRRGCRVPRAMDLAGISVTFGGIAFADLRPSHAQAWVKAMQDKPLEPSTIHTWFVNVRCEIRPALGYRVLAHDVTAKAKLPRQRKASAGMTIPSPAQVGTLLR